MPLPFAIPAALTAVKFGFAVWKWIAIGIAIITVLTVVYVAKSRYDAVEQRKGYDRAVAELKPQMDQLRVERDAHLSNLNEAVRVNAELVEANKRTVELYEEQAKALEFASSQVVKAQDETRRILDLVARRTRNYDARIAELVARVNSPVVTGENTCEESNSIARSIMRERVRNSK